MSQSESLSKEQREAALRDILADDLHAVVPAAKLLSSDRSTTSRLVALLDAERREANRHGILYALSWHADLGTWDRMVRILADSNETPKVRGQASEALAYMFHKLEPSSPAFETGVKALVAASKDPSPEVRYCVAFALGATGHPPLIPVLEKMLSDETEVPGWVGTVSHAASEALESLEGAHRMRRERGL